MEKEALNLFQLLVQAGAVPGKHFSFNAAEEVCLVTEQGYQLLKQKFPQFAWDEIFEVYETDPQQAIAAVHNYLGVNFVDRILERINRRLRELPQSKAAWYIRQVLGGVEQRTGISLYRLLSKKLSLTRRAHVECLLHPDAKVEPCGEWIGDLVQAAGGSKQDVTLEQGEAVLNERAMRLLASVWAGEQDLYGELANG